MGRGRYFYLSVCHARERRADRSAREFGLSLGPAMDSAFAIPGKGNAGLRGGGVGDLYVVIRIGEHPLFRREGDDIHTRGR